MPGYLSPSHGWLSFIYCGKCLKRILAQGYSGIFDNRLKREHAAPGICKIYAFWVISKYRCSKIVAVIIKTFYHLYYVCSQCVYVKDVWQLFFLSIPCSETENLRSTNLCPCLFSLICGMQIFCNGNVADDKISVKTHDDSITKLFPWLSSSNLEGL